MYSETKVAERLDLAREEFKFTPEYHSVDEVAAFESRLRHEGKYTFDEFGNPAECLNLTAMDRQWMLNEQVLVMCDHAYALTRYAHVKDETGVIDRFHFRVAQRILFEMLGELEDMQAAIEIMILKARQLGMSTLVELLIGLRIIFSYGVNAVIGSADQSMTGRMAHMLFLMYDMLPVWLRPQWTRRVESDRGMLQFGHQATSVSFQHGSQKQGIGTGTTPTLYHLSEVALYDAAGGRDKTVELIDEGLWKAVHASPNVLGILESTGRGDTGWWADTWRFSKDRWEERKCRMCPIFLPWFVGRDIYPTPTWLSTRPVPSGWLPNRDTRQHVAKCELYVRAHPRIERHLLRDQEARGERRHDLWKMPIAQQWFWEVGHEEAKYKGKQASWYQEMAGDDIEALQRSGGEPVFGHDTIAEIQSAMQPSYEVYGITGQSIEEGHEPLPDYIDYHRQRVPLVYKSHKGESYRWELIPMRFGQPEPHGLPRLDPRNAEDPDGLLIVWQPPQPNISYSIGVDTSEGRGMDSTSISVWALGWGDTPDTQVAEFTSGFVSHVEAFSFVLAIATYYSRHMDRATTRWKEPYVAVEQVAAVGDVCQAQMARMGYSNFHRMIRYDKKNLAKLKKQSRSMGWFSYGWSRPILIGHFVHWARNHWADINSPWLLDEMKHFEVHYTSGGKERMEHEDDFHDDRIFAAAMAIFCPHDMDKMAQRSKKRIVETDAGGLPKLDLTPYAGMVVPASVIHRPEKYMDSLERLQYAGARRPPSR